MMIELSDEVRAVIESGRLAHLTTINRDGSPHTTIVWVGVQDDEVVIGKLAVDRKVRNLRRDPRCTFSMEAEGVQHGMRNYLVVEGTARVEEGGAPAWLQHLAHRYVAPDAVFPPLPDPPEGFLIRITPTRVFGFGPWGRMMG